MEDKFLTTKMTEKILTNKKNGMGVLLGTIVLLLGGVFLCIFGAATNPLLTMVGILILCLGWIPFLGLKVLKPQEALVLTLFGKYIGTLKGDGFYAVNPFCTSVNPAAKTRLILHQCKSSGEDQTRAERRRGRRSSRFQQAPDRAGYRQQGCGDRQQKDFSQSDDAQQRKTESQ